MRAWRHSTFGATRSVPMPELRLAALALFFIAVGSLSGQPVNDDCANAVNLCAQQPVAGDNTGAVGSPAFCQPGGRSVWYTFTTNSVGGPVTVSVDNLQCPPVSTMNNALRMVVLSGDGNCTLGAFQAASPCASDSVAFTVTTSQSLLPATQYWVMVSGASSGPLTAAQCTFNISVSGPGVDIVDVDFDAGPDVSIPVGGSVQLHAVGGTTYEWSPTSGLSGNTVPDPVAQPNESTIYTVSTEINGCTYEDAVRVDVVRLISPVNTFTPNGDGINDTWDIPGIRDYPQADVSIYDRWGQRVFHSIGYREPFDGAGLPTATYYWYIQLNDVRGKSDPYTGYVTIVH
jgi:gliding motility-associated-like protein